MGEERRVEVVSAASEVRQPSLLTSAEIEKRWRRINTSGLIWAGVLVGLLFWKGLIGLNFGRWEVERWVAYNLMLASPVVLVYAVMWVVIGKKDKPAITFTILLLLEGLSLAFALLTHLPAG